MCKKVVFRPRENPREQYRANGSKIRNLQKKKFATEN